MEQATEVVQNIENAELIDQSSVDSPGISYQTMGGTKQVLIVQLDSGETVLAEPGSMSWMNHDIKYRSVKLKGKRYNRFEGAIGAGVVALSPANGNKITGIAISDRKVLIRDEAYLSSEEQLAVEKPQQNLTTGMLNRRGLVRTRQVSGNGILHISGHGDVILYSLKPDDELNIDESHLLAYEDTVRMTVDRVSGGLGGWIYGGEGMHILKAQGPGQVWLQTQHAKADSGSDQVGGLSLLLVSLINWLIVVLGFAIGISLVVLLSR